MNDKLKAAAAAKRTVAMGIVSGLLIALYGLWISRGHITHIGYALKLTPFEAETLFVLVDFLAIYGKVLTHKRLQAKTRRIGYRMMLAGGTLSLTCNVASGVMSGGIGAALYGAFVVGIVAWLEYAIANTKAKATQTAARAPRAAKATTQPELTARQVSARKGAETRKRNAAAQISPGRVPLVELNASMAQ